MYVCPFSLFVSFLASSSSSLFSSKTCHLVVDRAGERKFSWVCNFDSSNLPAHELGALFVLGNLRKRLEPGKVFVRADDDDTVFE